jgi:Predicted membrane protein
MRIAAGAAIAAAIVLLAYWRRSLSSDGAVAAFVLGVTCSAAGWGWAALLIGFFLTGTILSRYKADRKSERTSSVVEKGGNRDAWQVLANGGVFSAVAAASILHPSPIWMILGAGSIGAAAADTWATEIGVLSSATPTSIISGQPVTTGQSGGVTVVGTVGGAFGAVAMAIIALLAG